MWRGCNADTKRRLRKVWEEKRLSFWQETPDAGTIRQVHYLLGIWSRAGSHADQVSGKRQTPVPLSTALRSTRRRSSTVSPDRCGQANVEKSGWALAQCRYAERYHNLRCQEGQVSADQREREKIFMAARALDFLVCGAVNELHSACGWLYYQISFPVCRCRPEDLGHQEARIVEMSRQQPDQSHIHMEEPDHFLTLAQEFWDTDQVLFARGLLPRDWLPANELARMH